MIPDGTVRPQAAIVHGAACHGLYSSVIGITVAKKTYGVGTNMKWYTGCRFPESTAAWDSTLQEMRVDNVFSTLVQKDATISPGETFKSLGFRCLHPNQKSVKFEVFQSGYYSPIFTTDDCEKLGKITVPCHGKEDKFDVHFTFGSEIRVEVVRDDGDRHFTHIDMD